MKKYSRDSIIETVKNLLTYHSDDINCLAFAELLLNKINKVDELFLSSNEISKFLFKKESNLVDIAIFNSLRAINADMSGVSFDNIIIKGLYFNGLEGGIINLDSVPEKDLSNVCFEGVRLTGNLDDAIIENTNFTGYIGDVVINPQNVKNKSIRGSKLSGVKIDGSFDNVNINGVDFTGAKGEIVINPQKIANKEFIGVNLSNVLLCGDEKESNPNFDGCTIYDCKFNNSRGNVVIDLDTIPDYFGSKLCICDLTNVIIKGNAKSNYEAKHCVKEDGSVLFDDCGDDLFGSYYYNENGEYVHIHLFQSMSWDKERACWKYILRNDEKNLQFNVEFKKEIQEINQKRLSLFRKK